MNPLKSWDRAQDGSIKPLLIIGPAGSGKASLARDLLHGAAVVLDLALGYRKPSPHPLFGHDELAQVTIDAIGNQPALVLLRHFNMSDEPSIQARLASLIENRQAQAGKLGPNVVIVLTSLPRCEGGNAWSQSILSRVNVIEHRPTVDGFLSRWENLGAPAGLAFALHANPSLLLQNDPAAVLQHQREVTPRDWAVLRANEGAVADAMAERQRGDNEARPAFDRIARLLNTSAANRLLAVLEQSPTFPDAHLVLSRPDRVYAEIGEEACATEAGRKTLQHLLRLAFVEELSHPPRETERPVVVLGQIDDAITYYSLGAEAKLALLQAALATMVAHPHARGWLFALKDRWPEVMAALGPGDKERLKWLTTNW